MAMNYPKLDLTKSIKINKTYSYEDPLSPVACTAHEPVKLTSSAQPQNKAADKPQATTTSSYHNTTFTKQLEANQFNFKQLHQDTYKIFIQPKTFEKFLNFSDNLKTCEFEIFKLLDKNFYPVKYKNPDFFISFKLKYSDVDSAVLLAHGLPADGVNAQDNNPKPVNQPVYVLYKIHQSILRWNGYQNYKNHIKFEIDTKLEKFGLNLEETFDQIGLSDSPDPISPHDVLKFLENFIKFLYTGEYTSKIDRNYINMSINFAKKYNFVYFLKAIEKLLTELEVVAKKHSLHSAKLENFKFHKMDLNQRFNYVLDKMQDTDKMIFLQHLQWGCVNIWQKITHFYGILFEFFVDWKI